MNDHTAAFLNYAEELTRRETAAALVELAFNEPSYLVDLPRHSPRYLDYIASEIDLACDRWIDADHPEPDDATRELARDLLKIATDEWIRSDERDRDAALADAIEAGDVDVAEAYLREAGEWGP